MSLPPSHVCECVWSPLKRFWASLTRLLLLRFQVDPPGTAKDPAYHMLMTAADVPPSIGDGLRPPVALPTTRSRRSLRPCPDDMVWVPWFRSGGRIGCTGNFAFIRVLIQLHFKDDNAGGKRDVKTADGQAVSFFDEGVKQPDIFAPQSPVRAPARRQGPITASAYPAAVIIMAQDAALAAPSVGRIPWHEFTSVFRTLMTRRADLKNEGIFASIKALPEQAVTEALAWLGEVETAASHPILVTCEPRVPPATAVSAGASPSAAASAAGAEQVNYDEGLEDISFGSRPPFKLTAVDASTPLPPKPSSAANFAVSACLQPVVIACPYPMPARGTRARQSVTTVQGDDDGLVTVSNPSTEVSIIYSARGKVREGRRLLEDGRAAGAGVGEQLQPIVKFPGVRRVGLSSSMKDTFVGLVRSMCTFVLLCSCGSWFRLYW